MNFFTEKRKLKYLWISFAVFFVDFISKYYVVKYFEKNTFLSYISVIGNFFRIKYVKNYGAAFSFKIGNNLEFNRYFFITVVFVACFFIIYLLLTSQKKIHFFAYTMILGGAIGNLFDRIKYGYVIDFLDFDFPDILMERWAVFNIADSFIVIAIMLLFFENIFYKKKN